LPQSNAWQQTRHALLPEAAFTGGRPLTPLHGGHVGLLCTSGLMNGVFGENEDRHIARWRTLKVTTAIKEPPDEDGAVVTRSIQRFANDLALVYEDGRVLTLQAEAPKDGEPEQPALPWIASRNLPKTIPPAMARGDGLPGEDTVSCEKLTGHLFPLGRTVMTPGIRELICQGLNFTHLLERHADGDWGDLSKSDIASQRRRS
jgi:hypothetical protein